MKKRDAYYSEWDPFAAQWIRNLIKAKLVAPGEVDERSITKVQPEDLKGFAQVHAFAGIAGWSYALRLAGWSDERECWTGSAPCQPWSVAGKQGGAEDERHLYPPGPGLSAPVAPKLSSASKLPPPTFSEVLGETLKRALEGRGSTLFKMTWKTHSTPSGRSIYRLRASALRISGNDCGSWPTPNHNTTGAGAQGREGGLNLQTAVQLAGWPTERSADGEKNVRTVEGSLREVARKGGVQDLCQAAMLCAASPRATPTTRDWKDGTRCENVPTNSLLGRQVWLADSGAEPTGSLAATASGGQLTPAHSLWLMGFPPEWESCAPQETRSSRKSPRGS